MSIQKKYAVIVGVSDYEAAEFGRLRFCDVDAFRLRRVLQEFGGFDVADIRLFTDCQPDGYDFGSQKPGRSDVMSETKRMAEEATGDDLILFFFAGHGAEISKKSYLITDDTRLNVLDDTAIEVETLNKYFQDSKARCKIRIFDACRSPVGTRRGIDRAMSDGFERALLTAPTGTVTISSCSSGQYAYEHDDVGQGVFSYYLCEGLSGAAADDDGHVTLERLLDYLKQSVANECKRRSFEQTVQYKCDLSGDLVLATVPLRDVSDEPAELAYAPMAALKRDLGGLVAAAPRRTRSAQFTRDGALSNIIEVVFGRFEGELSRLTDLPLTIERIRRAQFHQDDRDQMPALTDYIRRAGALHEWNRNEIPCTTLQLRSHVALIPPCKIQLAVLRFSYFYWLSLFMRSEAESGSTLTLAPPYVMDSWMLFPPDAEDHEKLDAAVDSALERVRETVSIWAEQRTRQISDRIADLGAKGVNIVD